MDHDGSVEVNWEAAKVAMQRTTRIFPERYAIFLFDLIYNLINSIEINIELIFSIFLFI